MSNLSATQKADAYDALVRQIRDREPSVNMAIQQRGGSTRVDPVARFFMAFDALVDRDKQRRLGDRP